MRRLFGVRLSDPLSGYFMVRRSLVERVAAAHQPRRLQDPVRPRHFCAAQATIVELPYRFRLRERGESKLDPKVSLEFAALLVSKLSGGLLPLRFVLFCVVGGLGIAVHLAVAWARCNWGGLRAGATVGHPGRDDQQFLPQQRDHAP